VLNNSRMMLRTVPALLIALLSLFQPCPAPWLAAGAVAAAEAAAAAAATLSSEAAAGVFQVGGSIAKIGGQLAAGIYGQQNRWKLADSEALSGPLDRLANALELSPNEGADLKDAVYGWAGKDGISLMRFFQDVADMKWTAVQAQIDRALAVGNLDQKGYDALDFLFYVPPKML
jgi:hypothetical protein